MEDGAGYAILPFHVLTPAKVRMRKFKYPVLDAKGMLSFLAATIFCAYGAYLGVEHATANTCYYKHTDLPPAACWGISGLLSFASILSIILAFLPLLLRGTMIKITDDSIYLPQGPMFKETRVRFDQILRIETQEYKSAKNFSIILSDRKPVSIPHLFIKKIDLDDIMQILDDKIRRA